MAISLNLKSPKVFGGENSADLASQNQVLASAEMDLSTRYPVESVNEGFKENILTAVYYFILDSSSEGIITLNPGEVFSFHNQILPEFKGGKIITQKSGFLTKDGYKYVAGLAGNGVCHLASLMNMVASQAGLGVIAPTSHSFAKIPGVEPQYGTSIKYYPNGGSNTQRQNLYIRNNFDFPVYFSFKLEENSLLFLITK